MLAVAGSARLGPADPGADHGDHVLPHDDTANADDAHAHGARAHDAGHAVSAGRHRFASIVSIVGPLVLILSFALSVAIFLTMRANGPLQAPFVQRYFTWLVAGNLTVDAAIQLDPLSMVMTLVVTGVGALIHVFSVGYMRDDPGYPRYFAFLNLFVFFMLVLVLGASYPVLFVGWEGVGLCSYLLIGFWFSEKANADAGKKAFIVNRIGDFGFLVAMMLLFTNIGALDFSGVAAAAPSMEFGGALVTSICLFFFLGCAGKSAQIPLYVWLPDAMAGPTPVSALIHAATMVTAGVYLIARSAALFSMAPVAGLTVAVVGGVTALFAATIGLKQWDIKRVLAYSTVSQLGYMFMAVGVGAYVAGIFHLVTHAFFKALLFLGSGSVIYAMHAAYHATHRHEDAQDMRNMGGLQRWMRVTCVLMWVATLSIAGIPLFAGFFSKDEILGAIFERATHSSLASAHWLGLPGSTVLFAVYALGVISAFLTAIYMTRMMLYTFHGPNRTGDAERSHLREAPWIMTGPLVVLGLLSAFGGWLNLPSFLPLGRPGMLDQWLEPVVGAATARVVGAEGPAVVGGSEFALVAAAVGVAVAGILIAFVLLKPRLVRSVAETPAERGVGRILAGKYFIDEVYDRVIVRPVVGVSRVFLWRGVDSGLIDGLVNGSGKIARGLGLVGSWLQSGQVGTYAWVLLLGVLAVLGAVTVR
jgi:NADH-quinone oxidoreductase subunit L